MLFLKSYWGLYDQKRIFRLSRHRVGTWDAFSLCSGQKCNRFQEIFLKVGYTCFIKIMKGLLWPLIESELSFQLFSHWKLFFTAVYESCVLSKITIVKTFISVKLGRCSKNGLGSGWVKFLAFLVRPLFLRRVLMRLGVLLFIILTVLMNFWRWVQCYAGTCGEWFFCVPLSRFGCVDSDFVWR